MKEDTVPEANPFVRVATGSLLRLTWAYAVGWVIVVCVNGNGGNPKPIVIIFICNKSYLYRFCGPFAIVESVRSARAFDLRRLPSLLEFCEDSHVLFKEAAVFQQT